MNNLRGYISAFACGLVASIPWVLLDVYGGLIAAFLATLIALGAEWGYKKMGGEPTPHLGKIIAVITIIIVILNVFITIPLLELNKAGMSMSIANLKWIYNGTTYFTENIMYIIISIVFAILGVSNAIKNIDSNPTGESTWSVNKRRRNLKEEQNTNAIKDIFLKLKAFDEESAIDKTEFEDLFAEDYTIKATFNKLKGKKIIKKINNKFYMLKDDEKAG